MLSSFSKTKNQGKPDFSKVKKLVTTEYNFSEIFIRLSGQKINKNVSRNFPIVTILKQG